MRYMIVVKATAESEAEVTPAPEEALLAAMVSYHEELAKAGVLVDASGLRPSRQGWRIRYAGKERSIVDGPFAETKELIAGYTIIRVGSRQEAIDWSLRFPNPVGEGRPAEIEVRPFWEIDDFAPSESIDRFKTLEAGR
jgi:hypothetical protein